ncbi:MAG: PIN domain-containing protein [Deltaproteobacteria bacterium]|nr:PIN domain-containing protein [Deltaproteobacteria bacterium]
MNALIVDTSSWISYFAAKAREDDIDLALQEGRIYLPPVVAAELMSARLPSSQKTALRAFLEELPLCESALDHWIRVGELRAELAVKGLTISTPDAHVAQCAIDLKCFLLTEDGVFEKISLKNPLRLLR